MLGKRKEYKVETAEDLLKGAKISPKEFVVTDGNIITAKGMGSALKFSYALAKNILSKTDSDIEELSNGLMEYKNS